MDRQTHWDNVYRIKQPHEVSWFRPHLEHSIERIQAAAPEQTASIIDVGGGESTLVEDLLALGYRNLTVLDISQTALDVTKARLGEAAKSVRWICGDVTKLTLPEQSIDVWHDRAVLHFLTNPADRQAYLQLVERTLRPGGRVIVSTFGPEGPTRCSGLDTMRYDADGLQREFGRRFVLVHTFTENHQTPTGANQQFLYCDFQFD